MVFYTSKIEHEQIDGGYELLYAIDIDRVKHDEQELLNSLDGVSHEDLHIEREKIPLEELEEFIESYY